MSAEYSKAVTHPTTTCAQNCLTSEIDLCNSANLTISNHLLTTPKSWSGTHYLFLITQRHIAAVPWSPEKIPNLFLTFLLTALWWNNLPIPVTNLDLYRFARWATPWNHNLRTLVSAPDSGLVAPPPSYNPGWVPPPPINECDPGWVGPLRQTTILSIYLLYLFVFNCKRGGRFLWLLKGPHQPQIIRGEDHEGGHSTPCVKTVKTGTWLENGG